MPFRTGFAPREIQAAYQFPRKLLSLYNPQWTLNAYCAFFDIDAVVQKIDELSKLKLKPKSDDAEDLKKQEADKQKKIDEAVAEFFALVKASFVRVRDHLVEHEKTAQQLLQEIHGAEKQQQQEGECESKKKSLLKNIEECFTLLECIHSYRAVNTEAFRRLFEKMSGLSVVENSLEIQKKLKLADDIIYNSVVGTAVFDTNRAQEVICSIYGLATNRAYELTRDHLELLVKQDPNQQARVLPLWYSPNYHDQTLQRYNMSQGTFSARLLVGSASQELGADVELLMASSSLKTTLGVFANGEVSITLDEPARGEDVFILESVYQQNRKRPAFITSKHANAEATRFKSLSTTMMELLLLIQTVKQSSACRVNAVIPFLPYNNRTAEGAFIAEMMQDMGVDSVVTIDMNRDQGCGNFNNCPVYNISMLPEFTNYLCKHYFPLLPAGAELTVVAPDGDSVKRAKTFADAMSQMSERSIGVASAIKSPRESSDIDIIGFVENRICIIIDTLIDEATKLIAVSKSLRAKGATSVIAVATHALFSTDAGIEQIANTNNETVDLVITSDSIGSVKDLLADPKMASKLRIVPCAPLLSQVIKRLHSDSSVSSKTLSD